MKLSNLSVKRGIETKLIQQIFIDNITKMAGDGLSFFKTGEKVMMVRVVGAYRGIKINWIIDNIFVCWIIEQCIVIISVWIFGRNGQIIIYTGFRIGKRIVGWICNLKSYI